MIKQKTEVKCPICKKSVIWDPQNVYRPFCCQRCQLIDLGLWANEEHFIPTDETVIPENEFSHHD